MRFWWTLWVDLSSERPRDGWGGVGSLPVTRVLTYLTQRGLHGSELEFVKDAIMRADLLYMQDIAAQQAAKKK